MLKINEMNAAITEKTTDFVAVRKSPDSIKYKNPLNVKFCGNKPPAVHRLHSPLRCCYHQPAAGKHGHGTKGSPDLHRWQ